MSKNSSNGKQELNKLFVQYESIEAAAAKVQAELDELNAKKSAAVKAIADKAEELGFGTGPFNRSGRHLTVSSRQAYETKEVDGKEVKVAIGEPTYFFRGPKAAAIDLG